MSRQTSPSKPHPQIRRIFARAAVQLLFVSGLSFRLEALRSQLAEALRQCGDGQMREAAKLSIAEVVESLVEANDHLERYGLQIEIQAGSVRMATLPVHAQPLHSLLESYAGDRNTSNDLTNTGLLVLSIIAYKQPVSLSEISSLMGTDARYHVDHLRALGLVDAIRVQGENRHRFVTTAAFAERFGINSPADLPPVT
jgi:segregation and condensation protein B